MWRREKAKIRLVKRLFIVAKPNSRTAVPEHLKPEFRSELRADANTASPQSKPKAGLFWFESVYVNIVTLKHFETVS